MTKESEKVDPRSFYLAGPMSSVPGWNVKGFAEAKRVLTGRGFIVINPHDLHGPLPEWSPRVTREDGWEDEWLGYMMVDIPVLLQCKGIVMLPGWKESRGARLELMVALLAGKWCHMYRDGEMVDSFGADEVTAGLMSGAATVIAEVVGKNSASHGGHVEWLSRTPQYHAHKVAGHAVLAAAQLANEVGPQPDGETEIDHLKRCLVRAAMGLSQMATLKTLSGGRP